ncbi:hypothetical protein PIB30_064817 [Stylosanthes scabra]|uniref:Chaperone DnaJ C-terminal domain-containing protein n=1 Tax=Stylosanthes scabra TaxID=79078 RepID=A0ABU6VK97_9FABA|nr:hypothetical protein [Stylosanthes scabra]
MRTFPLKIFVLNGVTNLACFMPSSPSPSHKVFTLAMVIFCKTACFVPTRFNIVLFCSPQIPKGVQPGQLLVLRGKGLPKHGYLVHHGDQYVRFRINFPTKINERQRAILEELAKEEIKQENHSTFEGNWLYQQLSTG